jgi:GntR family transcriptional regulator, transcriptional repressor for pyruvate dehydrogenase complex
MRSVTRPDLSLPADADAQLHQPRLAEVVAGILRSRIVDGQLPDGSRLPKQDDLLREFRVSRPSLREALRILEAEGLVSVQRGNVGGAIVRAPSAQSSAYMFGLVLQSRHVVLEDLAEAIRSVEPVAAALCARRRDRKAEVVPRLRAVQAEVEASVEDGVDFTRGARRFHEEFVRGCGNTTLIVMLGTLELMWSHQERQWAERAQGAGSYPSRAHREEVLDVHRSILDAIDRGDADYAAKLAQGHLRESQRYTLEGGLDKRVQAAPIGALTV